MNKVFISTLLSQANHQIRTMSVHITRAQSNFLVEKSLTIALEELKQTQKILEQARNSVIHQEDHHNNHKDQEILS